MAGRMEFDFRFGQPATRPQSASDPERPLRILLLGDFSGRAHRVSSASADSWTGHRCLKVDIDNFDDVLRRLAPKLELALGTPTDPALNIEIGQLDDFHPDELYQQLPLFRELKETRRRLLDPKTFEETAASLTGVLAEPSPPSQEDPEPSQGSRPESDAALLDRLLGESPALPPPASTAASSAEQPFARFIRSVVEPYVTRVSTPHQEVYVASVDEATTAQMRLLLHHPAFQALESAWRSAWWARQEPGSRPTAATLSA